MGRKPGSRTYNNDILFSVVEMYLPTNMSERKNVASRYMELSKEPFLRKAVDVKAHFEHRMCGSGKKPTGRSKMPNLQQRSQEVWKLICEEERAKDYGVSSDEEKNDSDEAISLFSTESEEGEPVGREDFI